jgi:hypothetical protein
MAKNKQQKKKERERRVAQKKHEAAAQKRAQEKTAEENSSAFPKTAGSSFGPSTPLPKTSFIAANSKKPFNYRRSGG